jgi:hypothetical protein
VSRVESPTDQSGEVLTVLVVPMLQQILTKFEKPPREQVDASKISEGDVKEYFKCGRREVPVGSALNSLLSFNSVDSTTAIFSAVKSLVDEMIIETNWTNCEKSIVQPYMQEYFLPTVLECLDNANFVEVERERSFKLKVLNEEGEILHVKGSTDHCAKIVNCDCRALVVEDKTICIKNLETYIAQAMSEMMVEIRDTFSCFAYVPERYDGVLHNCSEWIFIERLVQGNNVHWSYVRFNPIFTSDNTNIDLDNCTLVAKFLEHVLKVTDNIITEVRSYSFVSTALPLLSIPENNNDNGDNDDVDDHDDHDDDDDDDDDEATTEEQTRGQKYINPDRSTRRGTGSSSRHKHNVRTMRVSNAYNATSTGKENAYMPFTTANLSMRPTNFIKKF